MSGTMAAAQGGSIGGTIDEPAPGTMGGSLNGKDNSTPGANQTVPSDNSFSNNSFDGTWASASAGKTCKGRLAGTFAVLNGRLIAEGVSGRVGPDGSAKGVNHLKGYIVTWTGQFSGDKAFGQWRRNDGCIGTWEAVRE